MSNQQAQASTNRLGTAPISRLLLEFSVPATVGMLVNAIYNVVDRLFIGHTEGLSKNGLAAMTVAFPVMMIMMAFAIMIGVGGSTMFSIHLGRREKEKADSYLGNALLLMIFFSVLFTVFGILFLDRILILFGASETVLPYAREYLSIVLYGAVFQTISLGLNNFIRANGSPNISMISMIIGAVFNIVFDAVLIFGFGMGMAGAALATIGGQALSTLWGLLYFRTNKQTRISKACLKPSLRKMVKIITTGIPSFVMNVIGSVLQTVLNASLLKYGGDLALSAMGIVNSLQTFLVMPVVGINQGMQPIVSYNFGAGKINRAHRTLALSMISATVITIISWALSFFFPVPLVSIFTTEAELIDMAAIFCRNWFLALVVVGPQIVGSNYFQAVGKPGIATVLTLMRQVLVLIPLILILPHFIGLYGITYAAPISDLITGIAVGIALAVFLPGERKRMHALQAQPSEK